MPEKTSLNESTWPVDQYTLGGDHDRDLTTTDTQLVLLRTYRWDLQQHGLQKCSYMFRALRSDGAACTDMMLLALPPEFPGFFY